MVLCAICRFDLDEDESKWPGTVADKFIYKGGELAYIELAHAKCVSDRGEGAEWRMPGRV